MASSHLIYLGTYTRNSASQGLYAVRLDRDTGALSAPEVAASVVDPAWVALTPDKKWLYTIQASSAQAIGFAVDGATGRLSPIARGSSSATSSPTKPPSFLAVDATGRVLLAANYHDSFVAAIPIQAGGAPGPPRVLRHAGHGVHPTRQEKPHVHSVTVSPDNRFVIVADLGLDKIFSYALDPAAAELTPATPPFVATAPGAGPRHFKFGADGRHGYVVNELNNTVTVFDYDATHGALTARQTVSTLPADFTAASSAAEVRVHPNGRFLYASNRGHDSVAVFAIDSANGTLAAVEFVESGGRNPRNFALSPDGNWLVCGHQDTPLLTVFRVDATSGRLMRTKNTAEVPACVCVLFYD